MTSRGTASRLGLVLIFIAVAGWVAPGLRDQLEELDLFTEGTGVDQHPGHAGQAGQVWQVARIARHVDGDTVWLQPQTAGTLPTDATVKVRLIGIDAPETRHPRRPVGCYGPQAATRLRQLIPAGRQVTAELDREPRDLYGRHLAYLWAGPGRMVNEQMAAEGYATVVIYRPNDRHQARLRAAESAARAHRRGLWRVCADERPGGAPAATRTSRKPASTGGG